MSLAAELEHPRWGGSELRWKTSKTEWSRGEKPQNSEREERHTFVVWGQRATSEHL